MPRGRLRLQPGDEVERGLLAEEGMRALLLLALPPGGQDQTARVVRQGDCARPSPGRRRRATGGDRPAASGPAEVVERAGAAALLRLGRRGSGRDRPLRPGPSRAARPRRGPPPVAGTRRRTARPRGPDRPSSPPGATLDAEGAVRPRQGERAGGARGPSAAAGTGVEPVAGGGGDCRAPPRAAELGGAEAARGPGEAAWARGQRCPPARPSTQRPDRHGLVEHARRPRAPGTALSQPTGANDLWGCDCKGEFRLGNGRLCYPLTVADQASRLILRVEALEGAAEAPSPCRRSSRSASIRTSRPATTG